MGELLYLDTARLGQMSHLAQQIHTDFVTFGGEEGCPLYFEDFLRVGHNRLTPSLQKRFPNLASWHGVSHLKESLRELTLTQPSLPLLLANRSAQLMKLAARLLFHPCRNVLVTDLGWPAYHDILDTERRRAGRRITIVPVRNAVLLEKASENEIVSQIESEYVRHDCDGLFLTAVNHEGIRLPIEKIVRTIENRRTVRFVVADGAQDFCHTDTDLHGEFCDLYITGCHKWLQAYFPMGIAFYGKRRSHYVIETILHRMIQDGDLDDPLLRFSKQLESDELDGYTETVNLVPLFSCQGGVTDTLQATDNEHSRISSRLSNLHSILDVVAASPWQPLLPRTAFQSGILLLQANSADLRQLAPTDLRACFQHSGIALTAYEDGIIRLSMPRHPWHSNEINCIR